MTDFYYTDSCYQLELNLQQTRRELIAMIESCELKDSAIYSDTECLSDTENKDNDDEQSKVAPGPDLLPQPKWDASGARRTTAEYKYDIQSWLQMGSLNHQINPSDATPAQETTTVNNISDIAVNSVTTESAGSEFCLKFAENTYNSDFIMKTKKIDKANVYAYDTVEAFFKSFKDAAPASTPQTSLAFDQPTQSPSTGNEYAYF